MTNAIEIKIVTNQGTLLVKQEIFSGYIEVELKKEYNGKEVDLNLIANQLKQLNIKRDE